MVGEVSTKDFEKAALEGDGASITDLVVLSGLATSKGAARKDLKAGGIYLNNTRTSVKHSITASYLVFGKYLLLREGKKSYAVLRVRPPPALSRPPVQGGVTSPSGAARARSWCPRRP